VDDVSCAFRYCIGEIVEAVVSTFDTGRVKEKRGGAREARRRGWKLRRCDVVDSGRAQRGWACPQDRTEEGTVEHQAACLLFEGFDAFDLTHYEHGTLNNS